MSRDPEQGNQYDPISFHKYLYANGDPINAIDPRGRESLIAYVGILIKKAAQVALVGVACAKLSNDTFQAVQQAAAGKTLSAHDIGNLKLFAVGCIASTVALLF
jgi:hypothetical protein